MIDDKHLMLALRSGDKEVFETIVLKHRAAALSFARRYIKDWHAAEDIVQECFAYLYVHSEKYDDRYSFKTYLYTIIRNKSIDYARKSAKSIISDNVEIHTEDDPEAMFILAEKQDLINECIGKMKDDYQTIINLIDFEGFSYKEAAKIMDKSVVQIRVLIYRARNRLKTLLESEGV